MAVFNVATGRFIFVKAFDSHINVMPGAYRLESGREYVWQNPGSSFSHDLRQDSGRLDFDRSNSAYVMPIGEIDADADIPSLPADEAVEVLGTESDPLPEPEAEEPASRNEDALEEEDDVTDPAKTNEPDSDQLETPDAGSADIENFLELSEPLTEPLSPAADDLSAAATRQAAMAWWGKLWRTAINFRLFAQAQVEDGMTDDIEEPAAAIVFSGFFLPEEYDNIDSGDLSLRLSLAAVSPGRDSEILVDYNIGRGWQNIGLFSGFEEISNALNGDYFRLALPGGLGQKEIGDLELRVVFRAGVIDPEGGAEVFLDALWLEVQPRSGERVSTQADLEEYRDSAGQAGMDFDFQLLSDKKSFARSETPSFSFNFKKKRSFLGNIGAGLAGIFYDEYRQMSIQAQIVHLRGQRSDLELDIVYLDKGSFRVEFPDTLRQFSPGRHSLEILIHNDGEWYWAEQDFDWGVLAFNVNKSIMRPGDNAYLQMGVLDERGDTICDAFLEMEITAPDGHQTRLSTIDAGIVANPECGPNNVINSPDYYAYFPTDIAGTYQVRLKAVTTNGEWEIRDRFEVMYGLPLEIERIGPSRIFPPADYEMSFRVRANIDFRGDFSEYLPDSFRVLRVKQDGAVIFEDREGDAGLMAAPGEKKVSWSVDWRAGEERILSYVFKAPDLSPEFYLLGPARFYGRAANIRPDRPGWSAYEFSEIRRWQIAADAISLASETAAAGTTNASGDFTVNKPSSVSDDDYLVVIAGKGNETLITAVSSGWTRADSAGSTVGNASAVAVFYKKVADASAETSTYTFNSNASQEYSYWIGAISGVDPDTPEDVAFSATWTRYRNTNSPAAPGITTVTDGAYVLAAAYVTGDNAITLPGSPWASRTNTCSTNNCLGLVSRTMSAAGATGNATFTDVASGNISTFAGQYAFRPAPPPDVEVSATGTQAATINIGTADNYVGGAFVFNQNTGSSTVTGVTIYETGTVDALNNLSDIRLYYDLDTSAPYDCISESFSLNDARFGATSTAFSAANGSATFSGAVAISTTSAMCLYVVLDVSPRALRGQTLEIEISDPTVDVKLAAGQTSPNISVVLAGTTVLYGPAVTVASAQQRRSDNFIQIANRSWIDENEVHLYGAAIDLDADENTVMDYYFELMEEFEPFTTATTVPTVTCSSGTAFASCPDGIWEVSATSSAADWYDEDWQYRKQITINSALIATTTSGFVVLATTTNPLFAHTYYGGHMGSSTGADIVITDADGVTVLDYERELYDPATGEMVLWIKTGLSPAADKKLYIYYGNPAVSADMAAPAGVWGSQYLMIHHLQEGYDTGTGFYRDSAGTNHGTLNDGVASAAAVAGKIGSALYFAGNSWLDAGNGFNLGTDDWTISLWIEQYTAADYVAALAKGNYNGSGDVLLYDINNAAGFGYMSFRNDDNSGDNIVNISSSTLSAGGWRHLTLTRAGTALNVYLDGVRTNSAVLEADYSFTNAHNWTIAALEDGTSGFIDAAIDEVRILNTARDAGWITTEYNNQNDVSRFLAFSEVEEERGMYVFEAAARITALPQRGLSADPELGYKWQILACSDSGECSVWNRFDPLIPNFKVDTIYPDAPGDLVVASTTATTATLEFGNPSADDGFAAYRIFYKPGASGVSPADTEHIDANLAYLDYNGAVDTTLSGLEPDTQYVANIWAYDHAGHRVAAQEVAFYTLTAPHARARSVEFLAGSYSSPNGVSGQNSNTNQAFSAFDFSLAENGVEIRNAYILFEAHFEAYSSASEDYSGYVLSFDACASPCTPAAFAGDGRVQKNSYSVLVYDENAGNQVRLLLDVTDEAQLAAYAGGTTAMKGQVGYRLNTGSALSSIAGAKAVLIVTYAYDEDISTHYTNTVVYPLMSAASGDSGSRRAVQADNCTLNSNCATFAYNMNIPEFGSRLSQWFSLEGVNDGHGSNDVAMNVNIQGYDVNSDTYYHEAANGGEQGHFPNLIFSSVVGYSENSNQTLEYYLSAGGSGSYYALGGEVVETYTAAKAAGTKTRTVSFPVGVVSNGQSLSTASSTIAVYFPENGTGAGIVDIKRAWFRIIGDSSASGAYTLAVSSKVGGNSNSSNYIYNIDAGDQVLKSTYKLIHAIPVSDHSELKQANGSVSKDVKLNVTGSSLNMGGVTAELMITYTYTDESSGYLSSLNLFGGQMDDNANAHSGSTAIARGVFPEVKGTKTVRAAGLLGSFLFSDADGDMPTGWFSLNTNVSAATPACTVAASRQDSYSVVYDAAGADTFTVPDGVTEITVKAWGAGGGGGGGGGVSGAVGGGGGGGGFAQGGITVTPTETLDILVGGGGGGGSDDGNRGEGGGGGGYSAILRSETFLIQAGAGGGGGGAADEAPEDGGGGGGGSGSDAASGQAGLDASCGAARGIGAGGSGATISAGGAGGSGCSGSADGVSGSANQGGAGGNGGTGTGGATAGTAGTYGGGIGGDGDVNRSPGGGGGGGGQYGGGGGEGGDWEGAGGGGGGSGKTDGLANASTGTGVTGGTGGGTGGAAANTGDAEYVPYAGRGGNGGNNVDGDSGQPGLVVVTYTLSVPNDNVFFSRADGNNSFAEFYQRVTGAMNTTDKRTYSACYLNDNSLDISAGAKMNGILKYTYQWNAPPPLLTQNDWRWFANADSVVPGSPLAAENTHISDLNQGEVLRLRLNAGISQTELATSTRSFKLQFAPGNNCAAISPFSWTDLAGVAGATAWRGYNNPAPANGATLPGVLLSSSDKALSFEESNPSAANPRAVMIGEYGEWDWVIYNNSAEPETQYCFRLVRSDGTGLYAYEADGFPFVVTAPDNSPPLAPFSLNQHRASNDALLANGTWLSENGVRLRASVNDPNLSDTLTLYFELASSSAVFATATSVPADHCLSGTDYYACSSRIWAASSSLGDYRATPFAGMVEIAGLPDHNGYKWQVLACDADGACSNWTRYHLTVPNFQVDTASPLAPGPLLFASSTPTSILLELGTPGSDANFSHYRIFYKVGSAGVTESDQIQTDTILNYVNYNGATSTLITNLSANTQYVFNIWIYDLAGNRASATPELVASTDPSFNPPSGFLMSSSRQRTDGSRTVGVTIQVGDPDNDDTLRAKLMYHPGNVCNFSGAYDLAIIDPNDAKTYATYGDPKVDNDAAYQVGTSSGWIMTSPGQNYVFFDWLAYLDAPAANGEYCLGLVVNDGIFDQVATHTRVIVLDMVSPTAPGPLTLGGKDSESVTLNFGAVSTDSNFREYKIFYKAGAAGVTEADMEFSSSTSPGDPDLGRQNYGAALSSTIGGLLPNTEYVFNIWAYDSYGNRASSSEELAVKTNAGPVNISADKQYLASSWEEIVNGSWIAEPDVVLKASAHDQDENDLLTFYYELTTATGTFSGLAQAPPDHCPAGTAFLDCPSRIWAVATSSSELPADWYGSDWLYRKRITVNSAYVDEDAGDFPLLIKMTDSDLAAKSRADGYDILFTDDSGTGLLAFEREYYNPISGELAAWVKSDISALSDTVIYMYYGNWAAASDLSDPANVWDSGYALVLHLEEDVIDDSSALGAHADSTAYGNHGDQFGNNETLAFIYQGQEFDGIDDYIRVVDSASLAFSDELTLEFWLRPLSYDGYGAGIDIVRKDGEFAITLDQDKYLTAYINSQPVQARLGDGWQHIALAYDRLDGQIRLYIDGSLASTSPYGAAVNAGINDLIIGAGLEGVIDEFRISSTTRSSGWLGTQYNNHSAADDFLTIMAESKVSSYYETVLVLEVPDNPAFASGYKWQVIACDDDGDCSDWDAYNAVTPNFRVDTTDPAAPGQLSEASKTSNSVALNFGAAALEDNFIEYRLYYSTSLPITEADQLHGSSSDANLLSRTFNSAANTTIGNLNPGTTYYFSLWAYDVVGRRASSTPTAVATNEAVSTPGVLFYIKDDRAVYYRRWNGLAWGAEQSSGDITADGYNIRQIRAVRSDDGAKTGLLLKAFNGSSQAWYGAVYLYAADSFADVSVLGSVWTSGTNNDLMTACIAPLSSGDFFVIRNNNGSNGAIAFGWDPLSGWNSAGVVPGTDELGRIGIMNGCDLVRRPGTDNYLFISFDNSAQVGSMYYFGGSTFSNTASDWTGWFRHASTEEDIDNFVGGAFFDPGNNTRGALYFSDSDSNNYAYARYFQCSANSINYGGSQPSPSAAPDDWGNDFVHGEFAVDPGGTGIAYFAGRDIGGELNVYRVNASTPTVSWSGPAGGDNISTGNLYSQTNNAQKPFAIRFYKNGKGVVVGNYATAAAPFYSIISTSGNSLSATSSVAGAPANIYPRARLYDDPNEDELLTVFQDDDMAYFAVFWDPANDAFYQSGSQAWTEVASTTEAADANFENTAFAYAKFNSAPSQPTGLAQFRSDASTTIANQGWTDEDEVVLVSRVRDADTSDAITVYLELLPNNEAYTALVDPALFNACDASDAWGDCGSKIWLAATSTQGDHSVTPFTATTTITGLNSSTIGYKWRVMACDSQDDCSAWQAFDALSPHFYVDTVPPSSPGDLGVSAKTSQSVALLFGDPTDEPAASFAEYKIFYRIGASGVIETDTPWTQVNDANLASRTYGGALSTTITGLASSTQYVFNIWAYDRAGNKAAALVEVSTTTNALPAIRQTAFIWENDDSAGVNTNSPVAATSTALSGVRIGERLAARIQIENYGGDTKTNGIYRLQFENATDAPGTWADVSLATEISHSPGLSGLSGAALSFLKTEPNAGTWRNGAWHKETGQSVPLTLAADEYTEIAFMVHTGNALTGKTYRLRLYDQSAGKVLGEYGQYPSLSSAVQNVLRYSKAAIASLPAGITNLQYFLDPAGYDNVHEYDGDRDNIVSANNFPVFLYATRHSNNTDAASSTWIGRSSGALSGHNAVLQVFRFGTTNAWITLDTEASAGAGEDFELSGGINSSLTEYYGSGNWIYWRVYQQSGSHTLGTDHYSADFSPPLPETAQLHFRWRADDGSEAAATWLEAEDHGSPTAGPEVSVGSSTRLRLSVANTGGGSALAYNYRLEYASSSQGCAVDPGYWETVPVSAAAEHFEMHDSPYVSNGSSTSARLANNEGHTFVAGYIVASPSNASPGLTLAEGRYTEIEYALAVTANADAAQTYCFRVTDAGNLLDAYDRYPLVTLAGSTNNTPYFSTHPADHDEVGASSINSPTNEDSDVTFRATADDTDGHMYYLAICQTPGISPGLDDAPACTNGTWCISGAVNSGSEASCTYTAATSTEVNAWYAYACDKVPGYGLSKCSPYSQGSGDAEYDSPFVINHRPIFSSVATVDDNKDPGQTYRVTAYVHDNDTAGGADTLTMYVCDTDSATFGAGCANTTFCSDIATSSPNASCAFSTTAPVLAGVYDYYVFIYDNHGLAANPAMRAGTYTVNNAGPVLGTLVLNEGAAVTLNLRGAPDMSVSAVNFSVMDLNGCEDIESAIGVLYVSSASGGHNCTADDNFCYRIGMDDCVKSDCDGPADMIATYTCTAEMKYFAVPTDNNSLNNPWKGEKWLSYLMVFDGDNYSATTSTGVDVGTNLGLAVAEPEINFGSGFNAGDNTGSDNSSSTVINIGNTPLNTDISGTDLSGQFYADDIPVIWIKWATSTFNYELETKSLRLTAQPVSLNAPRPTSASVLIFDNIYWGIGIPFDTYPDRYYGNNTFIALIDENDW